jgi:hypothetical protein
MANAITDRPAINPTLEVFLTAKQFKRRNMETAVALQATDFNPTMKIAITAAKRSAVRSKDGK